MKRREEIRLTSEQQTAFLRDARKAVVMRRYPAVVAPKALPEV
jgi:hypothetical protein